MPGPFSVAEDPGDFYTYNVHHGFPEGLVRGYRTGFLSDMVSQSRLLLLQTFSMRGPVDFCCISALLSAKLAEDIIDFYTLKPSLLSQARDHNLCGLTGHSERGPCWIVAGHPCPLCIALFVPYIQQFLLSGSVACTLLPSYWYF